MFNWNNYNTDKVWGHGYDALYNKYCESIQQSVKTCLEIGSREGSVRLWADYFPNAQIISADILHNTNKASCFGIERSHCIHLNQSSRESHLSLLNSFDTFNIIIDDGPHSAFEQILSLSILLPQVSSGGVYIIEDMHCTDAQVDPTAEKWKNHTHTIQQVLSDLQQNKYNSYGDIDCSHLVDMNLEVHVETATKIRWTHMTRPSDIAFIKVL